MTSNPYASGNSGYGAQSLTSSAGAPATPSQELIKDTTTATFAEDVIRESHTQPVILDVWAPWCGPCKQLAPALEKAVLAAGGRVKLVKVNIDEHPAIAQPLGVQSIPAVFVFVAGRAVDGFMGAMPDSEVAAFVDKIAKTVKDPMSDALDRAASLMAEGDMESAAQLFSGLLQHDPKNAVAAAGLAECYMASGLVEETQALLDQFLPEVRDHELLASVRTRLKLKAELAALGDADELDARLLANPDDHQARFDLALIAQAKGDRAAAAEGLLAIIQRDRSFDDDGARRKLLEFFEAWGAADPVTKDARRRLSSLLFS
ncbi:co-chaperone YbbN [Aureimonas fodinaquatilis]|uniref:Co-chaperone YbbN n=1 Tax=Aureimonas fodinaquatilis TaxID=2565783 RepID=A0A5B0DT55_9HYPH|nr:co-chaperone YbbN [Aureimonas fodinaquatilis]KAA0969656.1 co-chaperone YbbN [Aureimonas fodinaquatilis]